MRAPRLALRLLIAGRIGETRGREAHAAQAAGITAAAGAAVRVCLVAGDGLPVLDPEARTLADDLGLGPVDEGRVDAAGTALDPGARGKRGERGAWRDAIRPSRRVG